MRPDGKSRAELEREADIVRSRLLRTVEQLDRRGHDALDVRMQLRNHLRQVVIGACVLVVTMVAAIAYVVHRVTTAADRRRLERGRIFRGRWRRPAPEAPRERPLFQEAFRSVALGALTTLLMIPVRRLAAQASRPSAPPRPVAIRSDAH
jgi:hypothetical protein